VESSGRNTSSILLAQNLRRKSSEDDTTATASFKIFWTTAGIRLLASN